MERYTVAVSTAPGEVKIRLLVPCFPHDTVSSLLKIIVARSLKNGHQVSVITHNATLRLGGPDGPVLDSDDELGEVIDSRTEQIHATFMEISEDEAQVLTEVPTQTKIETSGEEQELAVRVITPQIAGSLNPPDRLPAPAFRISRKATLHQLRDQIATHLKVEIVNDCDHEFMHDQDCNCHFAKDIAKSGISARECKSQTVLVVHGKSMAEYLQKDDEISTTGETMDVDGQSPMPDTGQSLQSSLLRSLRDRFGDDVDTKKAIAYHSKTTLASSTPPNDTNFIVISICSKDRHADRTFKLQGAPQGARPSVTIDMHTKESPISVAAFTRTLDNVNLHQLAEDDIVDIFTVVRKRDPNIRIAAIGKSKIFRFDACWEPEVTQSDRGIAMFLSSLRVFSTLISAMPEHSQDALLHIVDLLCHFPPAVRALHILMRDKTPTAQECAAISHAMYHGLTGVVPIELIRGQHNRRLEGSRLVFGLILEKIKHVKLPADTTPLPYLSRFEIHDLRCTLTSETLTWPVNTSIGLVEEACFDVFESGAILAESPLQKCLKKAELPAYLRSAIMTSAGTVSDLMLYRAASDECQLYPDNNDLLHITTLVEMAEVHHLAALCGQNGLSVHRPSRLASAVVPCLTFDRDGDVAVYTGMAPCALPGQETNFFRPLYGDETPDVAVVEQLIAPILRARKADGTFVFDACGGLLTRRLEDPDEILIFCVDCSSSMQGHSDFHEMDSEQPTQVYAPDRRYIEPSLFTQVTLDETKIWLQDHECFQDILSAVAEASSMLGRRSVARSMLHVLSDISSHELAHVRKDLEKMQNRQMWGYLRDAVKQHQTTIGKLQRLLAGVRTYEQPAVDFLVFRAMNASLLDEQWTSGDSIPNQGTVQQLPDLPENITTLASIDLRCPISYEILQDPVLASDGHTYSRQAIHRWFTIRVSSPMTGLAMEDTLLTPDTSRAAYVASWIQGEDLCATGRQRSTEDSSITVHFFSPLDTFSRKLPRSLTLIDLYKIAFRGMLGKQLKFQLVHNKSILRANSTTTTLQTKRILEGDSIHIKLQDQPSDSEAYDGSTISGRGELCLIKVYHGDVQAPVFSYWTRTGTSNTVASILFKHRRTILKSQPNSDYQAFDVWLDLKDQGDGWFTGNVQDPWTKLAIYLNRQHFSGSLEAEPVFSSTTSGVSLRGHAISSATSPMVLKVLLSQRRSDHVQGTRMSRMDVLKQMYEAFVNRILAYSYRTHIGLVTFATAAQVKLPITHVVENFRKAVTEMEPRGDTQLWDGLNLAHDQIVRYAQKYPSAKKRIICLSDGQDTKSTRSAWDVLDKLRRDAVVLDSISLGTESNKDLRALSHLLGGYKFMPGSLSTALSICEMEPVLTLLERPEVQLPYLNRSNSISAQRRLNAAHVYADPTVVTRDRFPARKAHPNFDDSFVLLTDTIRATSLTNQAEGRAGPNHRATRLLTEMRNIAANPHAYYDCYVSESNMFFWKIVMDGPPGTPYEGGTFLLYLNMPERYPALPPQGRFSTPVLHLNVNRHGRICHSIFDRDWTSDMRLKSVLDTVYGLLLHAETSDPVNTTVTLGFHDDGVQFDEEIRDYVSKHAKKTRSQWKSDLLGEE